MSPYEKYMAVYYLVIHFKQYKEFKNYSLESRSIYTILKNDYIVCSGFTRLLTELLKKLALLLIKFLFFLQKKRYIILDAW